MKTRVLFSFALMFLAAANACNCGDPPPTGTDANGNIRRDAGSYDSLITSDANQQNDAGQNDDAATQNDANVEQDAATETDAAGNNDAATTSDAGNQNDANTTDDAAQSEDAAIDCPNEGACAQAGGTRCEGNAVQTCTMTDGCLIWSQAVACDDGESCSNGSCSTECTPECSQTGVRRCADTNTVEVCGQFDSDSCLDWGSATTCPSNAPLCSNGVCAATCQNECNTAGAKRCEGNTVEQCGDLDGDGCLNWTVLESCQDPQTCSLGVCADRCSDECSVVGERSCSGEGYRVCDNFDDDPCSDWGSVIGCTAGSTCSNGYCTQDCTEECTSVGETSCQGDAVRSCGQFDSDACLEWGTASACAEGETCSNGVCGSTCQNECDTANETRCAGDGTQSCGNYDGDPCLEWSGVSPCDTGSSCSNGVCSTGCSDDCSEGQQECVGSTGFRTCGTNYDSDACWDWSPSVACPVGETCNPTTNQCEAGCVNACDAATPLTCNDGLNTLSCVTAASGCTEWSTTSCPADQACLGTACAACVADAMEPNDSEAMAVVIPTIGANPYIQNDLSICQPDQDYFRYQASAGQNILINLSFQHNLGDLDLAVYSPSGNLVATGWSTTDNERAVINNTVAGDYIIQIFAYDFGRPFGDSNHYGLQLSTVTCTDTCFVENQRTCTDFNSIGTCADVNNDGCLEPETVTQPCTDGTACNDGVCTACQDNCTQGEEVCYHGTHLNCVKPNGYFCAFWKLDSECSATQMCNPDATQCQTCAADSEEPNNSFGTATALTQFGSITNKTICTGDRDFYSIEVPAGHSLSAQVSYVNNSQYPTKDLSVLIYKADQSLYMRTTGGSDVPLSYSNESANPETVYVEVASAYTADESWKLSTNNYSLTLSDNSCQNSCDQTIAYQCADNGQIQLCEDANGDGCYAWGSIKTCDEFHSVSGYSCTNPDIGCSWVCTTDAYDSSAANDDAGHATPLVIGNAASNLSICENDLDWFAVQVPAHDSVKFSIDVTAGDLDLYNASAEGQPLGMDPYGEATKSVVLSNDSDAAKQMYAVVIGVDGARGNYNITGIQQGSCINECDWVGYLGCMDATTQGACLADVDSDPCYEWDSNYGGACEAPTTACSDDNGCVHPCQADSFDSSVPNNNEWANSSTINDGDTSALTLCAGDVDFYTIPDVALGTTITLTATISTTLNDGDLDLTLYDSLGVFTSQAATTHNTEVIVFTARKSGDYYLRANLHAGDYAAYTLNVQRTQN